MERKKAQAISSAYRLTIFEDENGNHVITSLPTMIAKPDKSKYEANQVESDSEIDAETTEEITEFLETFFKLYPTASEKELEYYVENNVIQPINKNLKFVEITNPIYFETKDSVRVKVIVKYLDDVEKVTHDFQYNLLLSKGENWKITNCE